MYSDLYSDASDQPAAPMHHDPVDKVEVSFRGGQPNQWIPVKPPDGTDESPFPLGWCPTCSDRTMYLVQVTSNNNLTPDVHPCSNPGHIPVLTCGTCGNLMVFEGNENDIMARLLEALNAKHKELVQVKNELQAAKSPAVQYINPVNGKTYGANDVTAIGKVPLNGNLQTTITILPDGVQVYPINKCGMMHLGAERNQKAQALVDMLASTKSDEIKANQEVVQQLQARIAQLLTQLHNAGVTPVPESNPRRVRRSLDV